VIDPLKALAVLAFLLLAGAVCFWPGRGLYWRIQRRRRQRQQVRIEDALKHLYDCEYRQLPGTLFSLSGAMGANVNRVATIVSELERRGLVKSEAGSYRLTPEGRAYALRMIRTHRLWEKYLSDFTNLDPSEWHREAEYREHRIAQGEAEALAARLGNPRYDPHGDPIPTAGGEVPPPRGRPLGDFAPGEWVEIVHIEDEPQAVYAKLLAERLRPGMRARLNEVSSEGVRFETYGREHELAPVVAANLSAILLPPTAKAEPEPEALSALQPGESARVLGISPACRGPQRRRLLDLGIVPGTVIEAELKSPAGDPIGYRVRGAVIALRREQAELIHVSRTAGGAA
jgi:DtxR family Mn-dependent transcriptional regulator